MLGTQPTGRPNGRPMTGSAKQSILPCKERMDCFAALNDHLNARSIPRREAPGLCMNLTPLRGRGERRMPVAPIRNPPPRLHRRPRREVTASPSRAVFRTPTAARSNLHSVRQPSHPISRALLHWKLSDDGAGASCIVPIGRHPKPFTEADSLARSKQHHQSTLAHD